MFLQFKSLGRKILVPTLAITLLAFFLSFGYVARQNVEVSHQLFNSMGGNLVNYIAKTSVFYFVNYDLGALEGFVKEIIQSPDVVYAVFFDEKKKPMTTASKIPEITSGLLVFERQILNEDGSVLGSFALGFSPKSLDAANRKGLSIMVLCGVLALLGISLGIVSVVRKAITNPLDKAVALADQLARRDLRTVNIDLTSKDEIGKLLEAMRNLATHFAKTIGDLTRSAEDLNQSSSTILIAVGEQAAISNQQSASVTEITSTMEEFSASSSQIAENSKAVVKIAAATHEGTRKGASAVELFSTKMDEINSDSQKSIKEILDLGSKSNEITKVMEIINNIADQTKLIAFNAALEASSAGEAGKRFGVVASEIRRLADNVMESTGEIENKIREIQEATNNLVISSEKNSKAIREGMQISRETMEVLNGIINGAKETNDAAKQISLSTQQQKTASDQVVTALREIDQGARQTTLSIKHINTISKGLSELAGNLKKITDDFQL